MLKRAVGRSKRRRGLWWILGASLLLNAVLFMWGWRPDRDPASEMATPRAEPETEEPGTEEIRFADRPLVYVTNRFHWGVLQSTNYEEYVANLRSAGCPEETIRDIILPELRREYVQRERNSLHDIPFWIAGRERMNATREREAALNQLIEERMNLVQRLFGIPWRPDQERPFRRQGIATYAFARFVSGPVSEDTFERVVSWVAKCERINDGLEKRHGGIVTEEDKAEMRRVADQLRREIQSTVPPGEWVEMTARFSAFLLLFNNEPDLRSKYVGFTPAETREVALAYAKAHELFGIPGWFDAPEDKPRREAQFTNLLAGALGPERFADFVRAQDGDFRRVFDFTTERQLPREAAVTVYEVQQFARQQVKQLREDGSLDETVRSAHLGQMAAHVQAAVSAALGDKYEEYLSQGGSWTTNINGL